ncbi:hypothetical protein BFJ63_vAg16775 [Fusarium oxysporum f. sp. narcissi]|uniref:Uncharacterized protein n=1 Tax=Fusarium oxysporum f. sp. narcissi TaxID=451672 RepID=A0A4Q2V8Q9_FUSOX|nr:hypothetical protein BFJ63_vAg16775 [Fusarium oxysporum f. sp. narcissi]
MKALLPKHLASCAEDKYQRVPATSYIANEASADPYYNDSHRDPPSTEPMPIRMMAENQMEAELSPPIHPGKPAIPIKQTTLARLLLEWSSIDEREGIQ